jgi:glycosyltransferase involved in cell wall biosynthesis
MNRSSDRTAQPAPRGTPLRIGIDARLRDGEVGGVQQVVIGLAEGFSELTDGDEEYYFLVHPDSEWLAPHLRGACRRLPVGGAQTQTQARLETQARGRGPEPSLPQRIADAAYERAIAYLGYLPRSDGTIERAGIDVMHFTLQHAFLTRVASVYTPHDLQHLHHPEFFTSTERRKRERLYRAFSSGAEAVIVPSRWVRDDVVARYGLDRERVHAVPWAPVVDAYPAPSPERLSQARRDLALPDAFALYPAQTFRHKNHLGLVEAVARLRDQAGMRVHVVCSGRMSPFHAQIEARMRALDVSGQFRFVGFVSPVELQCLYQLARCLVFPSKFEGGGMPVLEAFRHGLPVASSNATCLAEEVGDAGLLFDPDDVPRMADSIARLWTDPGLRETLAERGQTRVRLRTWAGVARRCRAVYRSIAGRALTPDDVRLLRPS